MHINIGVNLNTELLTLFATNSDKVSWSIETAQTLMYVAKENKSFATPLQCEKNKQHSLLWGVNILRE